MLFLVRDLLTQFEGAQVQCQSACGSHMLRFVHARVVAKASKKCKLVSLGKRAGLFLMGNPRIESRK